MRRDLVEAAARGDHEAFEVLARTPKAVVDELDAMAASISFR